MSYISAADSKTSLSGLGCGKGCGCAPCRSQGGLSEWYEKEGKPRAAPAGPVSGLGYCSNCGCGPSSPVVRFVEDRRACYPMIRLGEARWARPAPNVKPLRFLNLDRFNWNRYDMTPRLKEMVDHLAWQVTTSWKTTQPISVIRLIGHTDNTGDPKNHERLGNNRAGVIKAALQSRLKSFMDRVLIEVEPSPGKSQPIASNATSDGRSRNRRVEVFVTFGVALPPPPPPCIDPRKCVKEPTKSVVITGPGPDGPIPPAAKGKSPQEVLDEKLSRLPHWLASSIRKAIVEGSCMSLERLLGSVVGSLSGSEKDELRRQCSGAWKKPM